MKVPLPRLRGEPETSRSLGWRHDRSDPESGGKRSVESLIRDISVPLMILKFEDELFVRPVVTDQDQLPEDATLVGWAPAVLPQQLGDPTFCADHGIRYAYLAGAMANGIGSVEIVIAMARNGMLGFFGAAGLDPPRIGREIDRIKREIGGKPYGVNLIHAPQEPDWEERLVDLLIEREVRLIEASAYLSLTTAVVRYRVHGIHEDHLGRIVAPNRIIAKVSRVEVASKFMAPPPDKILKQLVSMGAISEHQALLASKIPMAQDITAEADSGGHTDNRPAVALLPTLLALRDRLQAVHGYGLPLRVGMAGGIGTPAAAAAAFAMGAAYVLAGSIHQACIESGSSDSVREMLAAAEQADVAMAPAADMFEMGVNLQVLKRGTMFAMRAARLYEMYRTYNGIHEIPSSDRLKLEKTVFRASLDEIWDQTRVFFERRDPRQLERAERDPKHKMALIFRWYLGKSSNWANTGLPERKIDYQVWCGPAMGAFNEWVKGTHLEPPCNRRIAQVSRNILYGAAVFARFQMVRVQLGPIEVPAVPPLEPELLKEYFN